jgi:hypothetical protein
MKLVNYVEVKLVTDCLLFINMTLIHGDINRFISS